MQKLKIKLARLEADCLRQFLFSLSEDDVIKIDLVTLLNELIMEIVEQLNRMLNNVEQRKFTLKLSGAQCIAFVIFSGTMPLYRFPYEGQIVRRIIAEIDRKYNLKNYNL